MNTSRTPNYYFALYSYEAEQPGDLDFKSGDLLDVSSSILSSYFAQIYVYINLGNWIIKDILGEQFFYHFFSIHLAQLPLATSLGNFWRVHEIV